MFLLPLGPSSHIPIGCTCFNFICLQVELLFCHLTWECLVSSKQSFLIPYPASSFWLTVICFLSQGFCLFWIFYVKEIGVEKMVQWSYRHTCALSLTHKHSHTYTETDIYIRRIIQNVDLLHPASFT